MSDRFELKDGSEVIIRPMRADDVDRSLAFFESLSEQDRAYLRVDVTQREVVEQRIAARASGAVKRLIALAGEQIVADGALELAGEGWRAHLCELRLIVATSHQRKGLGMVMGRELYALGASQKVEEIVVKMMRPQSAARAIFEQLGFVEHAAIADYVQDRAGGRQDLLVMRCDLEAMRQKLEDYFASDDWQRTR